MSVYLSGWIADMTSQKGKVSQHPTRTGFVLRSLSVAPVAVLTPAYCHRQACNHMFALRRNVAPCVPRGAAEGNVHKSNEDVRKPNSGFYFGGEFMG